MTSATGTTAGARFVLTFDSKSCRWCSACELACSLHHEGQCRPSAARLRLRIDQFKGKSSAVLCHQCRKPFCLLACLEEAIVIDQRTGAPVILAERCNGCGACAEACPFNKEGLVVRLDEEMGTYVKCDLCGGVPECVEVCPTSALKCVSAKGRQ